MCGVVVNELSPLGLDIKASPPIDYNMYVISHMAWHPSLSTTKHKINTNHLEFSVSQCPSMAMHLRQISVNVKALVIGKYNHIRDGLMVTSPLLASSTRPQSSGGVGDGPPRSLFHGRQSCFFRCYSKLGCHIN